MELAIRNCLGLSIFSLADLYSLLPVDAQISSLRANAIPILKLRPAAYCAISKNSQG
jgi:hypothetical protein